MRAVALQPPTEAGPELDEAIDALDRLIQAGATGTSQSMHMDTHTHAVWVNHYSNPPGLTRSRLHDRKTGETVIIWSHDLLGDFEGAKASDVLTALRELRRVIGLRADGQRTVFFRSEREMPRFAIYDAETRIYLGASLTEEGRAEMARRNSYCAIEETRT